MTAELAPPDGGETLPRIPPRLLLGTAAVSLGAATLFWLPLLVGGSLHGHDWSTHHFHYFDWVRESITLHGVLPLYMADAWVTPNFIANAEAPSLGPLVGLLWLLPTGSYVKLLVVLFTAAGLGGFFLLQRDLGVPAPVALLLAAGFALGGFFASHVSIGHPWALGAQLLPLLLFLVRRAALGSDAALVGAAALNAFTIMGGQHQPFIWQNLLLGGFTLLWALRVRAWFPLRRFALLALLSVGLGAAKLVPLWAEFRDYAPTARIQGLPLSSLLPALLARGQTPERIDPAVVFEHGAGWWEYAFYVGPLAGLALLAAWLDVRRSWPLLAVGGFFLLSALEPSTLWWLVADLPVFRSQRCPARFLILALFAFLVAAGPGLARLAARRGPLPRSAMLATWALAAIAAADLFLEAHAWQVAGVGPAIVRRDHRPAPLRVRGQGATARLASFAPNRLVYRVEAEAGGRVLLPLRYGSRSLEWEVEGAEVRRGFRGRLAVAPPVGEHEVRLRFRPPGWRMGLVLSATSVVATALWLGRSRRRRAAVP